MSIHKVTNTFVGNGTALEADVNTYTPGKLGLFTMDNTALAAAYASGSATQKIQVSETFADGSFKKSMWIDGSSVISARAERYAPAAREVWSVGYDRKAAAGTIEVNNASDYTLSIRFKNDKSLYSERPEILRVNFTSSASATQLSIANQIANAINNSGFKTLVKAIIVSNGPLVAATSTSLAIYGDATLGAATQYGVEITALDINQFRSSTYKENRVYFSCHVDDSTGFGSTTTCTQIQANNFGEGTYNYLYNRENFDFQYEGLLNRRLWPAQSASFNVVNTGYLSANVSAAATNPTGNVTAVINNDIVTVATSTAGLRGGEIIDINGVAYEIKYILSATKFVITVPATASYGAAANIKVRYFYSVLVLEFNDNSFTSGADLTSLARKSVYIATPAIDAGNVNPFATTISSTEGAALLSALNTWLATVPAVPATLAF